LAERTGVTVPPRCEATVAEARILGSFGLDITEVRRSPGHLAAASGPELP